MYVGTHYFFIFFYQLHTITVMHVHYTEQQLKLFTGFMNLYLSEEKATGAYERGVQRVHRSGDRRAKKGNVNL